MPHGSQRKVIFRADGNPVIGFGHFVRTLSIADLIRKDWECVYAIVNPNPAQVTEINKVCAAYHVLEEGKDRQQFLKLLRGDEVVVLDGYDFDTAYQARIREKGCRLLYIDDFNTKHMVCDALLNNIPGFSPSSFNCEPYTQLYLGTDYAMLRKEFFNKGLREIPKVRGHIFVSFGGSNPTAIATKIIEYLNRIDSSLSIHLLAGNASPGDYVELQNVKVHQGIPASEVALLMAEAEVCIVPASTLLNETASVGSRIILGHFAENQVQPYNWFVDNGMAIGVGNYTTVEFDTFKAAFLKARKAEYLIANQQKQYRYQQPDNIRRIFNQFI